MPLRTGGFTLLRRTFIHSETKRMFSTTSSTQGVVLIVDKAKGINCRAASAKALEQFQGWTSPADGANSASSSSLSKDKHPKKRARRQDFVKMGHAGTLDPMATGCLPVLLGQATKLQDHIPIDIKRYTADLRLGVKTESDDADGAVVKVDESFQGIALDFDLEPILSKFRGKIMQTPPIYSAIHIDGKRAYDLARAGETPTIPPRQIHVHRFVASVINGNTLRLDVTCGTGTYIRTLGTDLAKALGTEGHLIRLRRVSSGPFSVFDDRSESSDVNEIVRVLNLKEVLDTFAEIVDLSGETGVQADVLTGRSANLFKHLSSRVKRDVQPEKKVALSWDRAMRALMVINFEKETITSVCHFKEDDVMPFVPTLIDRRFSSEEKPIDELRVCQFNVLADGLSGKRPDGGGFVGVPRASLNWDFRRPRIFEEIARCQPHIVGLEEFDRFDDLRTTFGEKYDFVYKCKPSSPCLQFSDSPDGCVIMFDKARLQRVTAPGEDDSFSLLEEGNHVAACVAVKDLARENAVYLICCAHFKATKNAHGELTRVAQAQSFIAKVRVIADKYAASQVFVCTDLNGLPTGEAYPLLAGQFRSAMADCLGGREPEFTTAKQRGEVQVRHTIDYIFYASRLDASTLRPVRYLDIPHEHTMLPNWSYPSDHILLCVGFSALK